VGWFALWDPKRKMGSWGKKGEETDLIENDDMWLIEKMDDISRVSEERQNR
jgi:hypothetical protein